MRLDVRNELANEEIAVTHAALGGGDVESALAFGRDYEKIGGLSLLAELFDQVPSTAFEQSLFVIAESMQKIKHWITPRRRAGSRRAVAGWQHNAVVNGLTEEATFQRVAIDAALGVDLAEQERATRQCEPSQTKPSQTTEHRTSLLVAALLVAQCLHGIETRGSGRRVEIGR